MKNSLLLNSRSGAGSAADGDQEKVSGQNQSQSAYSSPVDRFMDRVCWWVLTLAFLYILGQVIRAVVR